MEKRFLLGNVFEKGHNNITNTLFIMRLTLLLVLLHLFLLGNSQVATKKQYLIATFEMKYDKPHEYNYFIILPQKGADTTIPVYQLLKYENRRKSVNADGDFYYNHQDTSKKMYNYFVSPTEGLNYMASMGWNVIGIYPVVSSDWRTESNVPITTVSSSPAFCFQKEVTR
jgi:hypothetical protein